MVLVFFVNGLLERVHIGLLVVTMNGYFVVDSPDMDVRVLRISLDQSRPETDNVLERPSGFSSRHFGCPVFQLADIDFYVVLAAVSLCTIKQMSEVGRPAPEVVVKEINVVQPKMPIVALDCFLRRAVEMFRHPHLVVGIRIRCVSPEGEEFIDCRKFAFGRRRQMDGKFVLFSRQYQSGCCDNNACE